MVIDILARRVVSTKSASERNPGIRHGYVPHLATDHLNAVIGRVCSRNAYEFMIAELAAAYA